MEKGSHGKMEKFRQFVAVCDQPDGKIDSAPE
jgi:hypothetical protein